MASGSWIADTLNNASAVEVSEVEQRLIKEVITTTYAYCEKEKASDSRRKILLAAGFDLVIAAEYYRSTAHKGWVYCPQPPGIFYPYTNVCPRCVLDGRFAFHKANKPPSGQIGTSTSRLLLGYLQELLNVNKKEVTVFRGAEPVDAIFVGQSGTSQIVFLAEIKASPLVTPPLFAASQALTEELGGESVQVKEHEIHTHTTLFGDDLKLAIPKQTRGGWKLKTVPLGARADKSDTEWAHRSMGNLLRTRPEFIADYFSFWEVAYRTYGPRDQQPVFWLTNGCGQPSPRPEDWPRRTGGKGFESISDGKTSVGLDRTDDIKKGVYQVLKLGVHGYAETDKICRVGIVSNIFPVRHFEEYLSELVDVLWAKCERSVRVAGDLPPDLPVRNLLDGIVTLSMPLSRDPWIKEAFKF